MLLLLYACAQSATDDARLHHEAMQALEEDPARGAALCARIADGALQAECTWAAVERLALTDAGAARSLCAGQRENWSGECHFRLAERTGDPTLCDHAGAHQDDCRLHMLSRGFADWVPKGAAPGEVEELALAPIARAGLQAEDPRPWSALYRWVLGSSRPLDRGLCLRVSDPTRQEACLQTAVALFHDQLNHLRDRGVDLCTGQLPPAASYLPDPALDAALSQRRASDLCDPGARRAPPPPGLPGSAP